MVDESEQKHIFIFTPSGLKVRAVFHALSYKPFNAVLSGFIYWGIVTHCRTIKQATRSRREPPQWRKTAEVNHNKKRPKREKYPKESLFFDYF
jgi:hypothetical protein